MWKEDMREKFKSIEDAYVELPPEAILSEAPLEINDAWLRTASKEEQMNAMKAWWFSRYEDPAQSMPYDSREGGYQYVNGGPFDPADVLPGSFSLIVDEQLIQEVVEWLRGEVGHEWASLVHYEDDFDVEPHERSEPTLNFLSSLHDATTLVELVGRERSAEAVLLRHAFISLIAALETYLWETTKYWIVNEKDVVRNLVVGSPKFRDRDLKLGKIFDRYEKLGDEVNEYLKNTLWHRLDEVKPLMEIGMGVKLPSIKSLLEKVVLRHDLVHRNGRTIAGHEIRLTKAHVDRVKRLVLEFCIGVEATLSTKWPHSGDSSDELLKEELKTMGEDGSVEPESAIVDPEVDAILEPDEDLSRDF